MTDLQKTTFKAVMLATIGDDDRWFRARSSGERVTLASLYRAGALVRRERRAAKSKADVAYEYRVSPETIEAIRAEVTK